MRNKLNHSRYLDYYATDAGNRAYANAKRTPTAKQVKFYKKLYAMCKENNIDTNTGEYAKTRVQYAWAIDKLIERLQEHGVDVSGNGKDATVVLRHGSDRRGRYYTSESIEIQPEIRDPRKAEKTTINSLAYKLFVNQEVVRDFIKKQGMAIEKVPYQGGGKKDREIISGETARIVKEHFASESMKKQKKQQEQQLERNEDQFSNPIFGQDFRTGETWGRGLAEYWKKERVSYE